MNSPTPARLAGAVVPAYDEADLRRAAEAGTRAPSLHNSQPWLFGLRDGAIEIRIDPDRRLAVGPEAGRHDLRAGQPPTTPGWRSPSPDAPPTYACVPIRPTATWWRA